MKKSIMLMLLGVAFVGASVQAALFTDDVNTKALWHLDSVGTWYGIYSAPDDVSVRGGNVYDRQLRLEEGGTSAPDPTSPLFWSGTSNNGSMSAQFDGTDDYATAFHTWKGDKSSVAVDVSVDLQVGLVDGQRMGLVSTPDWALYLLRSAGVYQTVFEVNDGAGGSVSVVGASVGVYAWDDVRAEVDGNNISLTANGLITTGTLSGGMANADPTDSNVYNTRVILGRDFIGGNHYKGLMDEVRISNIPEPATIGLLGLASVVLVGARRFRL